MLISRLIGGGLLTILGLALIALGFWSISGFMGGIIGGVICLGLGLYMLLNKNEDKIEQIREVKNDRNNRERGSGKTNKRSVRGRKR